MVSLTEAMVATIASTLVIGASAIGLRTTETLIRETNDKATLRQNTANGMNLMRSEIERSIHLVVDNSAGFPEGKEHLDLNDTHYSDTISKCSELAGDKSFKPILGTKMIDLINPVIYGISTNTNGYGYSLIRCGAPLKLDGKYNDEGENLFLSIVLDDIGRVPCRTPGCKAEEPLENYLSGVNFQFSDGFTPYRQPFEPALRIETDSNYKLVKFVDPTEESPDVDNVKASFLEKRSNTKTLTKQDLYFAAFARADKRINNLDDESNGGILSGAFFQNISSNRVRFVVDGSGSMSACVMWGDGYANKRKFYKPGYGYFTTRRRCAFTRMESLQKELAVLLDNLPDDTRIGLRSFSSSGNTNHKAWNDFGTNLVRLGNEGVRESAIEFVYTLDDRSPTYWGGTDPWDAIQAAFEDPETEALYFLSDGQPNRDRDGGYWRASDESPTAQYYAGLNTDRNKKIKVHTTALGIESLWMEKLADLTGGGYNQVDASSLEEANGA